MSLFAPDLHGGTPSFPTENDWDNFAEALLALGIPPPKKGDTMKTWVVYLTGELEALARGIKAMESAHK
tara:strand:- start:1156 stop:1362 length:207 start_codon:yes stop_codon:yes gene_type:complete